MGYYYLTRETVTINGCTVDSYYRTDGDHTGAFGIKAIQTVRVPASKAKLCNIAIVVIRRKKFRIGSPGFRVFIAALKPGSCGSETVNFYSW